MSYIVDSCVWIDCISALEEIPLNIDWNEIEEIQYHCIKSGMNKVGLLDIAIAQKLPIPILKIAVQTKGMYIIKIGTQTLHAVVR